MKTDIFESYFNNIKSAYRCKVCNERFGEKYILEDGLGSGSLLRLRTEEGLEITMLESFNLLEMEFDNRGFEENLLEVGYCYCGEAEILMLPSRKVYTIRAGDAFIYKMLNNVEKFQFKYKNCKTISISMSCEIINKATDPKWKAETLLDWQRHLDMLFKKEILIVEKASYEVDKITKKIDELSKDEMFGYVSLKSKTLELVARLIYEKNKPCNQCGAIMAEREKILRAQEIIENNLESSPSVKALASQLDMSVYKLQNGFKEITGDTVHNYIKKIRVGRAMELLRNTDLSILQIANEVGYENPSKFAQLFKVYNQMTPLEYRKL
ncbi:AraC family transcriptional regulator [Fusibacter sp. 3D3]|uniref:helix-turn-helix domain-containing protein n=1 Tax=Fusibacter sp. 3D3 TaxID=1048380 RepID=UPI000853BC8D|nr:AraC family transcriptional regulator [Fusibacter sp. 3D3]GAU75843.1 transcriptional regulator, AraC family [Fusibacter sp. 3D3]